MCCHSPADSQCVESLENSLGMSAASCVGCETLVGLSRKTEGCQHIAFNPNRTLTYKHLKNIVITFNLFLKVNLLLFSMRFVSLIL